MAAVVAKQAWPIKEVILAKIILKKYIDKPCNNIFFFFFFYNLNIDKLNEKKQFAWVAINSMV